MASVYALIRNIAVFLIVMQIIMGILPNEKYGKYIRLMIGIYVVSLTAFYIRGFDYKEFFSTAGYHAGGYEEKLNQAEKSFEEFKQNQYEQALSTVENKIKTELDLLLESTGYHIKALEIGISQDVDSVDYGKLQSVEIILAGDVDKSGNIHVNNIIIGEKEKNVDDKLKNQIITYIVEQYEVKEEGVKISIRQ